MEQQEPFGKCPFFTTQKILSGKWTILILHLLEDKSVRFNAFALCDKLTSITFPSSVESIESPFYRCPKLLAVTVENPIPPYFSDRGNLGINIRYIYVPAKSVEAYKNAQGWRKYSDIIQAIP